MPGRCRHARRTCARRTVSSLAAEVCQHEVEGLLRADQHVLGLHVAVDDAQILDMGERAGQFGEGRVEVERVAAIKEVAERSRPAVLLPLVEGAVVQLAEPDHADDVGEVGVGPRKDSKRRGVDVVALVIALQNRQLPVLEGPDHHHESLAAVAHLAHHLEAESAAGSCTHPDLLPASPSRRVPDPESCWDSRRVPDPAPFVSPRVSSSSRICWTCPLVRTVERPSTSSPISSRRSMSAPTPIPRSPASASSRIEATSSDHSHSVCYDILPVPASCSA